MRSGEFTQFGDRVVGDDVRAALMATLEGGDYTRVPDIVSIGFERQVLDGHAVVRDVDVGVYEREKPLGWRSFTAVAASSIAGVIHEADGQREAYDYPNPIIERLWIFFR